METLTKEELIQALEELEELYGWLSQSPTGNDGDLHGLDVALTLVRRTLEI